MLAPDALKGIAAGGRFMRKEADSPESKLGLPEYHGHSVAEKTAFAALIVFVGASAAGAFGGGPASETVTDSASGKLQVEYQRFLRRDASEVMVITAPTPRGARSVELTFNAEYLRRVQITEVFPEPVESTSQGNGKLRFNTDGTGEPIEVRLHYQARLPGFMTAHLAVASAGEQVRIKQLVYP
jgi:hypothetical protein